MQLQHFVLALDKFETTEDLNDDIEKAGYEVDRCRKLLNVALAAVRG